MPRRIFSAGTVSNTTGAPLRLTFHSTSTTGRRETDLWTVDGSNNLIERIPNGVIVTDTSGAYSAFAGPDDIDTLYVGANGGSRSLLTATGYVASSVVDAGLNTTYAPILTPPTGLTYNADGSVATQTVAGVTTSYTYNADGTVATETRAGVTRTYTYNTDGTLASVA